MTRRDEERLRDVLDAIAVIRSHLRRGDLSDGLVFDAVRVRFIEIGEAVKAVSPEVRAMESDMPWQQIAGMRDRLAHHYFDTSHAVLQQTVDHDLPELEKTVERLLGLLDEADRGAPSETSKEIPHIPQREGTAPPETAHHDDEPPERSDSKPDR